MKFDNEDQKRKFIDTTLNEGIEKAKQNYIRENIKSVVVTRDDPFAVILGDTMHINEIKKKYPGILVLTVNSEKTKKIIDEL